MPARNEESSHPVRGAGAVNYLPAAQRNGGGNNSCPGPRPQDVLATPDARLRGAGLSRAKVAAIKDLATHALGGVVPSSRAIRELTDAQIVEQLTVVRGIGPWTVEMLLIFHLGRPDVWPVTDYGVRKGFARAYRLKDLPSPKELIEHGEKWRPYRTIAAWYFWRALELED